MGLFKPVWMTTNWKKENAAVDAVQKITDQIKLARVAQNAPIANVRMWAVEKMTDQVILASIAKNDTDSNVRSKAVQTLTEQSFLIDFAKNDKDSHIRWSAINNLSNKSVLEHIAKNDNEDYVRKAANEKLASINQFDSDDVEVFFKIIADCRFAYAWDEGYKAFSKLQTLCGKTDVRLIKAMFDMIYRMFGEAEESDRFANHVKEYIPEIISVDFVKEYIYIADVGINIIKKLRHIIPVEMIIKACNEINFSDDEKKYILTSLGIAQP